MADNPEFDALAKFRTDIATSKAWWSTDRRTQKTTHDAKDLQNTNPLAWWITVENFIKVHEYFKEQMLADKTVIDDTAKKEDVPKGSIWSYIKEQPAYPYKGLKDLGLNEVFEEDVEDCRNREEVEEWLKTNPNHLNTKNIHDKLNTYKIVKARYGKGVNAYDMTNYCSIPSTRTTGLGIAMHMHTEKEIQDMTENIAGNKEVQPQVMLSHAWTEDMDEVVGILKDCVKQGVKLADGNPFTNQTRVWFCCFAIYQPYKFDMAPRVNTEEMERGNITVINQMNQNGFQVVSKVAEDMIVIHTTKGDAYARMWCIVELWEAIMASKHIHMIGSKEYFSTFMTEVAGEYVLKGHPATKGNRGRRDAISGEPSKGPDASKVPDPKAPEEIPNFQDFLVDFRKSEAGGNKVKMEAALNKQIAKMNEEFVKGGGLKKYSEKYMALENMLGGELAGEEGGEVHNIYEKEQKTLLQKLFRPNITLWLIRLLRIPTPQIMERKPGDIKDDGVTFVENVVAYMRMKWLQNVAKSWNGKTFTLPHWKINSHGELVSEEEGKGVIVKSNSSELHSIDISGYRSSSGGYTQSSSFPRLANSLAQATDNMIAHSEQLEDELASKEAIITSQEQRIQNQNARIAALERQATRAAPTRRVTANTRRTTARNRNADEEQYYC